MSQSFFLHFAAGFALIMTLISLISSVVLAKFTNALVRSKPLKEIGAEQVSGVLSAVVVKVY